MEKQAEDLDQIPTRLKGHQERPRTPNARAQESPIENTQIRTMRDQFYRDLNDFTTANELEIEFQPRIESKGVELFDLAQVVEEQNAALEEVDWTKVARDLGFGPEESTRAIRRLEECYQKSLIDFLEAMANFEESEEEVVVESDEGEAFETAPAAPAPRHSLLSSQISSSPLISLSEIRKRASDQRNPQSSGQRSKRKRLSKDDEIPATPYSKLGSSSRASKRRSIFIKGSPETPSAGIAKDIAEPSLRSSPLSKFLHRGSSKRTTTTHQVHSPPHLQPFESSFDVSPSQQLQFENIKSSPLSLRFNNDQDNLDKTFPSAQLHLSRDGNSPTATLSSKQPTRAKKRSLPSNFVSAEEKLQTSSQKPPMASGQAKPLRQAPTAPKPDKSATEAQDNRRQIKERIEYYEMLGYAHNIVVRAFEATTMTPGGLAAMVMQSLKDGQGIPSHHEGIWTDRDDKGLLLVDSVDIGKTSSDAQEKQLIRKAKKESDRIMGKHGLERMELRRRFLAARKALIESKKDAISQT